MSDEPIARKAMREAEQGARPDPSRLIDSVPALMREAERRRVVERLARGPSFDQAATRALPRLAAVTAVAVIAATWVVVRERGSSPAPAKPATFDSVILGGGVTGETGDVVFDALLNGGRNDG